MPTVGHAPLCLPAVGPGRSVGARRREDGRRGRVRDARTCPCHGRAHRHVQAPLMGTRVAQPRGIRSVRIIRPELVPILAAAAILTRIAYLANRDPLLLLITVPLAWALAALVAYLA